MINDRDNSGKTLGRKMEAALGDTQSFRTRVMVTADGEVMLRTKGGMPELTRIEKKTEIPKQVTTRTFLFRMFVDYTGVRETSAVLTNKYPAGLGVESRTIRTNDSLYAVLTNKSSGATPWKDVLRIEYRESPTPPVVLFNGGTMGAWQPATVPVALASRGNIPCVITNQTGGYEATIDEVGSASSVAVGCYDNSDAFVTLIGYDGTSFLTVTPTVVGAHSVFGSGLYLTSYNQFVFRGVTPTSEGSESGCEESTVEYVNATSTEPYLSLSNYTQDYVYPQWLFYKVASTTSVIDESDILATFDFTGIPSIGWVLTNEISTLVSFTPVTSQGLCLATYETTFQTVEVGEFRAVKRYVYPQKTTTVANIDFYQYVANEGSFFETVYRVDWTDEENVKKYLNISTVEADTHSYVDASGNTQLIAISYDNRTAFHSETLQNSDRLYTTSSPVFGTVFKAHIVKTYCSSKEAGFSVTGGVWNDAHAPEPTQTNIVLNVGVGGTPPDSQFPPRPAAFVAAHVVNGSENTTTYTSHNTPVREDLEISFNAKDYIYFDAKEEISLRMESSFIYTAGVGGVTDSRLNIKYVLNIRGAEYDFPHLSDYVYGGTINNGQSMMPVVNGKIPPVGVALLTTFRGGVISPMFMDQSACPFIAYTTKAEELGGADHEFYMDWSVLPVGYVAKAGDNNRNVSPSKFVPHFFHFAYMRFMRYWGYNSQEVHALPTEWETSLFKPSEPKRLMFANGTIGDWRPAIGATYTGDTPVEITRI